MQIKTPFKRQETKDIFNKWLTDELVFLAIPKYIDQKLIDEYMKTFTVKLKIFQLLFWESWLDIKDKLTF